MKNLALIKQPEVPAPEDLSSLHVDCEDLGKTWQLGYDATLLRGIANFYRKFNSYTFSRFTQLGADTVANLLRDGKMQFIKERGEVIASYSLRESKTSTTVRMCAHVDVGRRKVGDKVVEYPTALTSTGCKALVKSLNAITGRIWLHCWVEDRNAVKVARAAGFRKVSIKLFSTGELGAIFIKETEGFETLKSSPAYVHCLRATQPEQALTFQRLGNLQFMSAVKSMRKTLEGLDLEYEVHPSKSNKGKSWSALSLYGYSDDAKAIHSKDSGNAQGWSNLEDDAHLRFTALSKKFPEVLTILKKLGNPVTDRIRLMRLTPGGGELTRHTDLIGKSLYGMHIGGLLRVHIPIITNPDVEFTLWDYEGAKDITHMDAGVPCFLDIRKPHRALNAGATDRVHLVMDLVMTEKLLKYFK
jgi:hypothetical protein